MSGQLLYIIFAGINGAGKSTLYRSGLWSVSEEERTLPRVNSDEIIVEHGWDWANPCHQIQAGKEAVKRIKTLFDQRASFNQETTLSGHAIMRNIKLAKELGYYVVLYYVGVEDPSIANARIKHRAEIGGHYIDAATVEKRAAASMENLAEAIPLCDEVILFDNTYGLTCVVRYRENKLEKFAFGRPVAWFEKIVFP
ncbi:MAG: hypothetical protein Q4C41_07730 [Eggerthellaceae bacterium]|nr:hypothetical protein [Eggerthellaceae bacterium]